MTSQRRTSIPYEEGASGSFDPGRRVSLDTPDGDRALASIRAEFGSSVGVSGDLYAAASVQEFTRCLGSTKTGERCRNWGRLMLSNGYCRFHQKQAGDSDKTT